MSALFDVIDDDAQDCAPHGRVQKGRAYVPPPGICGYCDVPTCCELLSRQGVCPEHGQRPRVGGKP